MDQSSNQMHVKTILKNFLKEKIEFWFSLIILWVVVIINLYYSLTLNNGHIIYSLDDAYIHMAIAKNFSQYGVWGVTKREFSSSSSSMLYSLLLAFIFLFGPNEIAPLIINLIFANLSLYLIWFILKIKNDLPSYMTFLGLILLIFFIPLSFLVFTGMEHTIQLFINIYFIYIASDLLSKENIKELLHFSKKEKKYAFSDDRKLLLIAPLITMVRFEGMFIIIIISLLFLLRKQFIYSILLFTLAFISIIIFGFISINYGWFFFPNSIILKGNAPNFTSLYSIIDFFDIRMLIKAQHILILLIGAFSIILLMFYSRQKIWNKISIMASIFILLSLLHVYFVGVFIRNQNLSRYDGYLVALGIILLLLFAKDYLPQNLKIENLKIYVSEIKKNYKKGLIQLIIIILIFSFIFLIYIPRSLYLIRRTPQATNNIHEQQYQMGLFLQKYYEGETVALNDIGAVNYLADIECLDLRGLGDIDVARAIVNDELDEEFVYREAKRRDCKIAIIYEDKDYGYDIPSEWTKVGEWKIKYNVVCGDDTVSFWAVDTDEIDNLIDHLKDFSHHLPKNVVESGNYTI